MALLTAACERTGLSPDTFGSLLSPEDVADIKAGDIPVATLRAYALSFAENIRIGAWWRLCSAKPRDGDHAVRQAEPRLRLAGDGSRALGLGGILEQAPGGAECSGQVLASEDREIGDPEMTRQGAAGALRVEMPGWAATEPPDGREARPAA